jgi:hypothetical protein
MGEAWEVERAKIGGRVVRIVIIDRGLEHGLSAFEQWVTGAG